MLIAVFALIQFKQFSFRFLTNFVLVSQHSAEFIQVLLKLEVSLYFEGRGYVVFPVSPRLLDAWGVCAS